ncbi:SDR family oxidoreductase [Pseudonocardia sp. EC080610-09]|uniref:SDR family NAD(P)-dependent oxidoreductase n=1 Tax=Pseudonocardia sp. EC080610-09 TaxID=1688404 RepID=UPI000761C83D|nr:SDR family NAD(P)-dependent oxidoreductase [Pseudonocardia sp. EC080610-09]
MPTALVSEVRSGLGAAYARELAERGYAVVLVERDAAHLADLAERIGRATGAIVETLAADLTDPAGMAAVERRIAQPGLPVELLVNTGEVTGATTPDAVGAASARLTRAAVTAMGVRGRGGILVVADAGADAAGTRGRVVPDEVAVPLRGSGVTLTVVAMGSGVFPSIGTVVLRSLGDLARGRELCRPDRSALAGYLDPTRDAVRRAARAAVRGRRTASASASASASADDAVAARTGNTRPSPVPTPFRDVSHPHLAAATGAGSPVLPELPVRPAHVAAAFPEPRVSGTRPLPRVTPRRPVAPVVPARVAAAGRTAVTRLPEVPRPAVRPVQGPAHDPATVRTAG